MKSLQADSDLNVNLGSDLPLSQPQRDADAPLPFQDTELPEPSRLVTVRNRVRFGPPCESDDSDSPFWYYSYTVVLQRERRRKAGTYNNWKHWRYYGKPPQSVTAGWYTLKKRSALFNVLPVDLFYEIAVHLHPIDLYNLSVASQHIRTILQTEQCEWVWKTCFSENADVRPPPHGRDPWEWSRLLFGPRVCQDRSICKGWGKPLPKFTLLDYICIECFDAWQNNAKAVKEAKNRYINHAPGVMVGNLNAEDIFEITLKIDLQYNRLGPFASDKPSLVSNSPPTNHPGFAPYSSEDVQPVMNSFSTTYYALVVHAQHACGHQENATERSYFARYVQKRLLKQGYIKRDINSLGVLPGYMYPTKELVDLTGWTLASQRKHPRRMMSDLLVKISPLLDNFKTERIEQEESHRRDVIERIWLKMAHKSHGEHSFMDMFPFRSHDEQTNEAIQKELEAYAIDQGLTKPPSAGAASKDFSAFVSSLVQKYSAQCSMDRSPEAALLVFECQSCRQHSQSPLFFGWEELCGHETCTGSSIGPFAIQKRGQEAMKVLLDEVGPADEEETKLDFFNSDRMKDTWFYCEICLKHSLEEYTWRECVTHYVQMDGDPLHVFPKWKEDTSTGYILVD